MNVWSDKITIFGESHGAAIGVVIGGLPAGKHIDFDLVQRELDRRAPGKSPTATARRETDIPEVLSGIFNERTTGAPLCAIIRNEGKHSADYASLKIRPGHADHSAFVKFGGFADYRGGGVFSGRLTAPIVFAGAVCRQFLGGISITATHDVPDEKILAAKADGDSVGGIITLVIDGVPAGLGDIFFGSVESRLSSLLFSIPAVKGVEFGDGFALAEMRGSEANDQLRVIDGKITPITNHNGGIIGGITNGAPIVVRVAVKPTPSIAKPQASVDVSDMTDCEIVTRGRHDPCIVPRAVPVVEAAAAIAMWDLIC